MREDFSSLLFFSASHPTSTPTHYLGVTQKYSNLMVVSLIDGHFAFDKVEHH
jgi:hypothetical protein